MEGCVAVTDLWGAHAAGWAEHERQYRPAYEAALDLLGAPAHVLDLGCGAGTFLRAAADRGARVSGLDASPALLELARMLRARGAPSPSGTSRPSPTPTPASTPSRASPRSGSPPTPSRRCARPVGSPGRTLRCSWPSTAGPRRATCA